MEWNERIAAARKAAGLTQEALGEKLGVSRQAVSKWESGQAVPDLDTVAQLCLALGFSADYLLFGREDGAAPTESAPAESAPGPVYPDTCPCCGRPTSGGTLCPACGYPLPTLPFPGPRYALTWGLQPSCSPTPERERLAKELVRYCGMPPAYAEQMLADMISLSPQHLQRLLRRDLPDSAVHYLAGNLDRRYFQLHAVLDEGEDAPHLLQKPDAMELPAAPAVPEDKSGIGFWGVVGAVVVALLILSVL